MLCFLKNSFSLRFVLVFLFSFAFVFCVVYVFTFCLVLIGWVRGRVVRVSAFRSARFLANSLRQATYTQEFSVHQAV